MSLVSLLPGEQFCVSCVLVIAVTQQAMSSLCAWTAEGPVPWDI